MTRKTVTVQKQWTEIYEPRLRASLLATSIDSFAIERVLEAQRQIYLRAGKPSSIIPAGSTHEEIIEHINRYIFDITWALLWEIGRLNAQLLKSQPPTR